MPRRINYVFPSLAQFLFLVLFLYLAVNAGVQLLNDADTGFHIRSGEYMLETRSIPTHDPFSFSKAPLPWSTHEWLSAAGMALLHRHFGLTGVVLFFALLISLAYSVLFKSVRASGRNILLDLAIVLLVIGSSQLHWLARPHILSYLLLIAWYFLLDSYQYRQKNLLYLLPPVMLLWVNLHGSFVLGIVLLGIYLACNFARGYLTHSDEREFHKEKARGLLPATVACLLVLLVNPKGFHVFAFPFEMLSHRFAMDNISEWLSPDFHKPLLFKYLLLLMIALFATSGARLNLIEISLIILFTNMSLYSVRYIPLFGIIAAPILSRSGEYLLDGWDGKWKRAFIERSNKITAMDAVARGCLWPVVAVVAVALSASSGRISYKFDGNIKPVAAVEFLKKERLTGHMFNNDEFGDYLIYSASGQYKVFFDGRTEVYGPGRFKEYMEVVQFKPGWEKILEKHGIDWIFFDTDSALSRFLLSRRDWHLIYSDKVASVFLRNIQEHQDIIGKYPCVKPYVKEENIGSGIQ
jgi:hypothetical protein